MGKEKISPNLVSQAPCILLKANWTPSFDILWQNDKDNYLEETMNARWKERTTIWGVLIFTMKHTHDFKLNNLNGKTRSSKMDPLNVLIKAKEKTIVAWILAMHKCGIINYFVAN